MWKAPIPANETGLVDFPTISLVDTRLDKESLTIPLQKAYSKLKLEI
jgi:hypothetical protein